MKWEKQFYRERTSSNIIVSMALAAENTDFQYYALIRHTEKKMKRKI